MPLRIARPSDAASLSVLCIEVWAGTYLRRGVDAFFAEYALRAFAPDRIAARLADPDTHMLVSVNEEGLDGVIGMTAGQAAPVPGCDGGELSTLYVRPGRQGQGIGTALLMAGLRHARDSGAPSVWLTVNAENTRARGFYLSQGFEVVGRTDFRIGDRAFPNDVLCHSFPG